MADGARLLECGWHVLLASGNLTNGGNAGVTYLNANNRSGNRNSNIGTQLTADEMECAPRPRLLPKHKDCPANVLVGHSAESGPILHPFLKEVFMRYLISIILTLALTLPAIAADVPVQWDAQDDAAGFKLQIGDYSVLPVLWGEIRDVGLPEVVTITENNATKEVHRYIWTGWPDSGRWVIRAGAYDADGMEAWQVKNYPSFCVDCEPPQVPTGTVIAE